MAVIPPEPIEHIGTPQFSLEHLMNLIHHFRSRQGGLHEGVGDLIPRPRPGLSEPIHSPIGLGHLGETLQPVGAEHPSGVPADVSHPFRAPLPPAAGIPGTGQGDLRNALRARVGLPPLLGPPQRFGGGGVGDTLQPIGAEHAGLGLPPAPPPLQPIGGVPGPPHIMAARAALAGYA